MALRFFKWSLQRFSKRHLRINRVSLRPLLALLAVLLLLSFSLRHVLTSSCDHDVRLAFSIQVSSSTSVLVPRLMNTLWGECNLYAIHFDAKMPNAERTSLAVYLLAHYPSNVLIIPSRVVAYAGVTMLLATLDAISALLAKRQRVPWSFFINLSAADYPLVSPWTMRKLLSHPSLSGLSLLQRQEATKSSAWFFTRRFGTIHLDPALWGSTPASEIRVMSCAPHPFAHSPAIPLRKSEGWVILWYEFAAHAIDSADARTLLALCANARACDEHYFATLHALSAPRFSVGWDALRHIAWRNGTKLLARPAYLDGPLAHILRDDMFNSGALFARKFGSPDKRDDNVFEHIDAGLIGVGLQAATSRQLRESAQAHTDRVGRRLVCVARFPNATGMDYENCIRQS